ncbi:MAG: hypothetical protein ACK5ME_10650 [Parahaliea sp.]
MIPVSKAYSVYLVTGFSGEDRLSTTSLGHVLCFEPGTHSFVSPGLTLEMAKRLPNYFLRLGNDAYPKWAGFRRIPRSELRTSYERFLRETSGDDVFVPVEPVATA